MAKKDTKPGDSAQIKRLREALAREKAKGAALARERTEAREQQAAAAEILKVISRSPDDAQPVFEAIVKRALRLMRGHSAVVTRLVGGTVHLGALTSTSKIGDAVVRKDYPRPIDRTSAPGKAAHSGRPSFIADVEKGPRSERAKKVARTRGYRSILAVPMLCDGSVIGTINVTRKEPGPFGTQDIDLLQTFAQQAVIAIENVRRFNETKEALERQTATSEVLKTISRSTFDLNAVLQVLIENATRLAGAHQGFIFRFDGEVARLAFSYNAPDKYKALISENPLRPGRGALVPRVLLERRPVHIPDALADKEFKWKEAQRLGGFRSMFGVPMMREGNLIGVIAIWRTVVQPFTEKQIELVSTFADQAVIAIENVRLFNETKEALERQTATSEILNVIARSPADVQPVLDAVAENAARLCGATDALILSVEENTLLRRAHFGPITSVSPSRPLTPDTPSGRAILERRTIHIEDMLVELGRGDYSEGRALQQGTGFRTLLAVPLMREDSVIGVISIRRTEVRPFTDKQIELVRTFADQAVIAIENVRLFNETKESLERQTATAEILKVIASSPTDVQPVFEVIVERAVKLCGARFGRVYRYDGALIQMVAGHGLSTSGLQQVQRVFPRPAADDTIVGRVLLSRQPYFLEDIERAKMVPELSRQMIQALNTRSQVTVPMLRSGEPIGAITLGWEQPDAFDDRQVALLQTFADQAVIAIENVRLFNETKEALQRQTATADILKVIAGSPADVVPVFDAIGESVARLCDAVYSAVLPIENGMLHLGAVHNWVGEGFAMAQRLFPMPVTADHLSAIAVREQRVIAVDNLQKDAGVPVTSRELAAATGYDSIAIVPMIREGTSQGALVAARRTPFTREQVALLQTFADQAVIAIQNVRLFNETKEALERQTATSEILQVIGSSPTDTQPVFDAIVNSGVRLFPGAMITVARPDGGNVRAVAIAHEDTTMVAGWRERFTTPLSRDRLHAAAILDAKLIDFPDAEAEKDGPLGPGVRNFLLSGNRAVTIMPMLRGEGAIGAISVTRAVPGPLSDKQIAILRTFADQAVIAIENVRLFNETKEALEQQKASAEILGVISNSISDTGPVFDKITESCQELFGSDHAGIRLIDDKGMLQFGAHRGPALEKLRTAPPMPLESSGSGLAIKERAVKHYPDVVGAEGVPTGVKRACELTGARSIVFAPMLWEGRGIGAIYVARETVGPFSEKEIALLKTFADQAVIAIQNARLFNETKEALERQTATADILKVIAGSPSDVQPVFDAIVQSGARLFGRRAVLRLAEDGRLRRRALSDPEAAKLQGAETMPIDQDNLGGRTFLAGKPLQVVDTLAPDAPPFAQQHAREWNFRSNAAAPLLREGKSIGIISVNSPEPGAMSDKQMEQLQTFADQAVIAIENVRLFNETREALERQTATAEILKVIASSPSDVQPVFDAIAASARRLLDGGAALVNRRVGDMLELAAYTSTGEAGDAALRKLFPAKLTGKGHMGKAILTAAPVLISDIETEEGYSEAFKADARTRGFRSVVSVPMMKDGEPIGGISVNRPVAGNFTEHQTNLLKTFADQAVIAIENVRLFNETKEALERQTATSEVLNVIARSPADVQPVLDAVAESAARLCGASDALIMTSEAGMLVRRAHFGPVQSVSAARPLTRGTPTGRAVLERRTIHVEDVLAEIERGDYLEAAELQRRNGMRTILSVPLVREDSVIGVISMRRLEVRPFTEKQIALVKTFADQAVIAIENVRLFNETKEALERQTATAEILKVIASSPSDVQPVFDAIVYAAARLFDRKAGLRIVEGDWLRRCARSWDSSEFHGEDVLPLNSDSLVGSVVLAGKAMQVADKLSPDAPPYARENATRLSWRSLASAPLMREGRAIGCISVSSSKPGPLSDKQMDLLATFADQAVIAIENVRLFNETKEALERQTATAEILKVISSSPTDVQPVLEALADSAGPLCDAEDVSILQTDGEVFRVGAFRGADQLRLFDGTRVSRGSVAGRAILDARMVHIHDLSAEAEDEFPVSKGAASSAGNRTMLAMPLMREGTAIGAIFLRRAEVRPFTDKQIDLLRTFADQAVIAIENVRLFNETKEALERQTATAEILKVISSSPTDVEPVFVTIVRKAVQLSGASRGALYRLEDDVLDLVAHHNQSPEALQALHRVYPMKPDRTQVSGRSVLSRSVVEIPNVKNDPEYLPGLAAQADLGSLLAVPMLRADGAPTGVIVIQRSESGSFASRHVELLKTFADQAVIAIENVRLFKELEARTDALGKSVEKLTALGEVGQAISSSLDLEQVLKTIATHAVQLTGLNGASIYEYDEAAEEFRLQVAHNFEPEFLQAIRNAPIRKGDGTVGQVAITRGPTQVTDILADSYHSTRKELLKRVGYRAVLTVPLLRDEHIIGALSVTRKTPGPFGEEIVELLKTFATQSAMAIQNARLFREIEEKGKQLEEASKHKSQFLASMSHELRTPLNAILGFNEMILGDVYGEVPGDMKEPLTDIQTSGKHLLRLINNVLDLAKIEAGRMELAVDDYSVHDTVESVRSTLRPLAEAKGLELAVDVPPDIPLARGDGGRITQCLMNLAGNSLKFTKQGSVGISVALNNGTLTYKVQDTGIGIPADKIGSLFTEFKQTDATIASEYGGTGLGLSITKKFIEMHGGRIWAESEAGSGSTFTFEVPLRAGEARGT